ncbi:MAG: aminotransferase class I/II-fold pyridoxal phosphate-dependent enzyme [Microscillaceae bacterium]|jgi:aromatic-L-amino-acid decarboxylase|nr:aminotransferase class I/II-fold pyridoxal phosphate-dependent enzyme [Microscillaceae bacterium]
MNAQEFRQRAHQLVEWMADYLENVEQYPVKSPVKPRQILASLPAKPPHDPEHFDLIFSDFQEKIMPGITHWQHPAFFAYFPANSSFPSILAEMLTATLASQCMIWETSPAAAELEEQMMEWLRQMMNIPDDWVGVIQDTASTATLCAILTAREKLSNYQINEQGFANQAFTVYCSTQTHSSIDKAVKIAGLGKQNLRKIAVDERFAMLPEALETTIQTDIAEGKRPLCVVAAIGTTSSTAIDPLRQIGEICQKYGVFLHVDGAYAGTAAILPEKRWILDGLELADSYVFNPHKWMLTNFDCTAYYVKDKEALIRTFEILPEYLKTKNDNQVNNYRDWGVQLGRRFRALKLWFVIRTYGVAGIQAKIRLHLDLAQLFKQKLEAHPDFEILAPVDFNLICFRYKPLIINDLEQINQLNTQLLDKINQSGKAYLTHTKLNDVYTLRLVIGQTQVESRHVEAVWDLILEKVEELN